MKVLPTVVIACLTCTIGASSAGAMSIYKWKYRPIVVFAASEADPTLVEQRRAFGASRSGLIERNVVIVWVVGDSVGSEFGPGPGLSAPQLRARFGASRSGYLVALVGKDGGVKSVQLTLVSTARHFGTIDAMPMRRDEMRRAR